MWNRPLKKAIGVVAGIGRPYGDRSSPIGNGTLDNGEVGDNKSLRRLCRPSRLQRRNLLVTSTRDEKTAFHRNNPISGCKCCDNSLLRYPMADLKRQDDNDDFCSACGGSGELLCCDGCYRSFHFKCLDPPMDSDNPPENDWFCQVCMTRKDPPVKHPRSLFSSFFDNLDRKNPMSFRLPQHIRDYFEGVRTAEGGEYEDIAPHKAR
jgi:hypothetical protein